MITTPIEITSANGKTIEQFQDLINKRIELLGEQPSKVVVACAIQVMKSLRAATRVAKVSKPVNKQGEKMEIEECAGLYYSMKRLGKGAKPIPCLRFTGSNQEFKDANSSFVIVEKGIKARLTKIYLWTRRSGRKVYIAASSKSVAQRWIRETEKKRIQKYKGMAKSALGKIMNKIATNGNTSDTASALAQKIAQENAHVMKNLKKNEANVRVEDALNYSVDALKGGESAIETCLQKAMRKIASIINKKMEKIFDFTSITLNFNN